MPASAAATRCSPLGRTTWPAGRPALRNTTLVSVGAKCDALYSFVLSGGLREQPRQPVFSGRTLRGWPQRCDVRSAYGVRDLCATLPARCRRGGGLPARLGDRLLGNVVQAAELEG